MPFEPVIVVVAFNRPKSLRRLLDSLTLSKNATGARLIISIDNKDPENLVVRDIAEEYHWPHGEKEVIYHPERLGLKKHVMKCADLSETYGSVIILEDDLFVSPYFYEYAVHALNFYGEDRAIGGISLYNQPINELIILPFSPMYDESDVYFIKFPSSLGQAWTHSQWADFKQWHSEHPEIEGIIHRNMATWPDSSWKKHFAAYLIDQNKYIVYPRMSLTTNFNDPGTNLKEFTNHDGQSQLRMFRDTYRFRSLKDSCCLYDHLMELHPETIRQMNPELRGYDFETDLYGLKEKKRITKKYTLTTKSVSRFIKSFRRALKPHELNVICNIEGDEIFLAETSDILENGHKFERVLSNYKYYYSRYLPNWRTYLHEMLGKRMDRLKRS